MVAIIGLSCFAAGVGTGLLWQDAKEAPQAAAPLPSKTPRNEPPSQPVPREPTPEQRERATKQAQKQDEARKRQEEEWASQRSASERIKPLIDDALQLNDEAKRVAAIDGIRKLIASKDPLEIRAGLQGLQAIYELRFDKSSFREVLLPHLQAEDPGIRTAAWYGLFQSGLQDGDLAVLRRVARDKGFGQSISHLLFMAEKGDLTGESGEIVRGLLDMKQAEQSREAMRGLWGAKLSPSLEADIIALSREPNFLHDTVYFALSTQANKSEATIDRLIEVLGDQDSLNNGGRAAWGLQQGVSKDLAPKVADAAIKIVRTRASGYMQEQCWTLVKRYAGPSNLDGLREIAALEGLAENKRSEITAIIAGLEQAQQGQ